MPFLPNAISDKDIFASILTILSAHERGDLESINVTTRSHVDPLRWSHTSTRVDHSLCDPLVCRAAAIDAAIDARLRDAARNPRADHEDAEHGCTGDEL